jgi:hypothetical protein
MATSFFGGAFYGGEFFKAGSTPPTTAGVGGGGKWRVTTRYWAPTPPPRKKKRVIDALIVSETRLKESVKVAETRGIDSDLLTHYLQQIEVLQTRLLAFALESQRNYDYITWKRKQAREEEEMFIILSALNG